ncbi:hypothetical protein PFISCL1PPCAC_24286, partial [Pristionchus fissidentatus]
PPRMCFHKKKRTHIDESTPLPSSSARTPSLKVVNSAEVLKDTIYQSQTVPNETKPEQVQNRLTPVIKNLFDQEPLSKTGGSSDLLAEKLAQQNKLDEAKDPREITCEDDANYYNIRKDILATIEDKSHNKKEEDTVYEKNKKVKNDEPKKTTGKMQYKKDVRQSNSRSNSKPIEKPTDYDAEEVNEKNFMYNLKEIDYCTHDMMRCIEEENLFKNIKGDSMLPDKVEPYGDLNQLAKRRTSRARSYDEILSCQRFYRCQVLTKRKQQQLQQRST